MLDGRYRVEARVATGGMSTVYRGIDTRLDRRVAIKVMEQPPDADAAFVERVAWEARAAARLDHPNVVEVFDHGVHHGHTGEHPFLVMELVDGVSLRELLSDRAALPVSLALSVVEPVVSALAAAHRAGLVHHDVKPENVLIGPDGSVKVADFGLARALTDGPSRAGEVMFGTAGYLAPERVEHGRADCRSDVYAAGIVLYEALTGARPSAGDEAPAADRPPVEEVPAPGRTTSGIPAPVDDLVRSATRRDPAARPHDGSALLLALRRVRQDLNLPQEPVPVPDRPPRQKRATAAFPSRRTPRASPRAPSPHPAPVRNRRAFVAWLAVVVLLAAATGTAGWWLGVGRYTTVPSVAGLDRGTATARLVDAGLEPTVRYDHHNTVPRGEVIRIRPAGGQREVRGSQVTLLVSLGRPVVPEVSIGASPADVQRAIRAADLRPVRGASAFSRTVDEGAVLALRPPPGTVLPVGAPVTLVLSKGPAPVAVPDVRGLTERAAIAVLTRAGLSVGEVRRRFDDDVRPGHVIASHPGAGERTTRGSEVDLVVSAGSSTPPQVG